MLDAFEQLCSDFVTEDDIGNAVIAENEIYRRLKIYAARRDSEAPDDRGNTADRGA
jgi:hypothetical protein